ncbi:helix-turn-helix domain-containing protein [Chryseomicrobium palamuruense]|uniref:Helix-turn-helix domain-containing protein n=1 Tax=Chryseomicrobium palamuruense TaxID=682973 RepID=A0ABV8UVI5_9BACL
MNYAEQLKTAMESANMTQVELAALTGIGKSSISQYLSGKNEPNQKRKDKIAEALGLNPETSNADGQTKNLSVKEAAELLGKSEQFVRVGLQRSILPFGTAVKLSSKWTYHISPKKFYEYIGQ